MNLKITKKLAFLAVVLLLTSCVKEQLENKDASTGLQAVDANTFELCLNKPIFTENGDSKSAKALLKSKLWENGDNLSVEFIGGSTELQEKVLYHAKKWEEYANIKFFNYADDIVPGIARIRVSFEEGGSWSTLGQDARNVGLKNPSMNLSFTDETDDLYIQRVTLHEFGHALGAIHEHQSPASTIQWDEEAVLDHYVGVLGHPEQLIRDNFFFKYSSDIAEHSEYDPKSIMHYTLRNEFTLNDFAVGDNYELSELDKAFIGEVYPFENDLDPRVPYGKTIWLKANVNNKYIHYNEDAEGVVEASTDLSSASEFFVENHRVGLAQWVALRSVTTGLYVCADLHKGSEAPLYVNRSKVGAWEKFQWSTNDDGTISLLSGANYMHVCADKSISSSVPLVADRPREGAWEKFTWGEK